jgi:hypothetical protein
VGLKPSYWKPRRVVGAVVVVTPVVQSIDEIAENMETRGDET